MDFKQLASFIAVVRTGSFTAAGEELFISQPTISMHVRALEEELEVKLLKRDTKKLELTEKGRDLYDCACRIMEIREGLIKRFSADDRHIIKLGASTIPSAYILPDILPAYGKLHPDTYFTVHQSDSAGIIDGLLKGLYDVGMTGMKGAEEELEYTPFYRDRMVIITPVNEHFLEYDRKCGSEVLRELLTEPIILRESGSGSLKSADRFFAALGINENSLNVTARINDQESIKKLVAGGLGISVISEKAAENFVSAKRLLSFDIPEENAVRNLYLVRRKEAGAAKKTPADEFADFVRKYYNEIN